MYDKKVVRIPRLAQRSNTIPTEYRSHIYLQTTFRFPLNNLHKLQERCRECGQGGGPGGRVEREAEGRRGSAGEARRVFAAECAQVTALKIL